MRDSERILIYFVLAVAFVLFFGGLYVKFIRPHEGECLSHCGGRHPGPAVTSTR